MKNTLKYLWLSIVAVLGLGAATSSLGAVVVEYHHVSETAPKSTSISPKDFIAHLDYLKSANFTVVPLTELVAQLKKGQVLPDKTIAITFDDAYASVYHNAFPLLRERGLPFTFFVNTDAVGTSSLFVSWDQLREMQNAGVTIANHTASHTHMVRKNVGETTAQWRTRLSADIERAQAALQKELGHAPKIFAYPFGEYNHATKALVKELGFIAFGQHSGVISEAGDQLLIPRFPFGGSFTDLDDFKLKVNSKALPIKSVEWFNADNTPLDDVIVKQGARPWLKLTLDDKKITSRVHCFASGQGAIVKEVRDGAIWTQANKAFMPGRMRYNCTAASDERGRFYWFTQQWLVTDEDGNWTYRD